MICTRETDGGIRLKDIVSGNFTGWSEFLAGECICPECAYIFNDAQFRRRSWVASADGFKTFKNDEARDILFNPPEPPFFISIAKRGQKQSWLSCLRRVAHNRNRYFFSHESYDIPIFFNKTEAEKMIKEVVEALEKGITKTELLTMQFKPATWKKAFEGGYAGFLKEITIHKGKTLWEVMVDVARLDTKAGR